MNMKVFREFRNTSMNDVVEEESFTAAVWSNKASSSAVSLKNEVGILKKNLISVRSLHGEALNFNALWKRLPCGELEPLVLGKACNNVISLGEITGFKELLGFV
jgi:hypothetical protein